MQRVMTARERIAARNAQRRKNILAFEAMRYRLRINQLSDIARATELTYNRIYALSRGNHAMRPDEVATFERVIADRNEACVAHVVDRVG